MRPLNQALRQAQLKLFDHVFAIGVVLIAGAFAFSVYVKSGQKAESIYWSIYAFGALFIPGIFTAYPGLKKERDGRRFETRKPRGRNLSGFRAIIVFAWIVGIGLVLTFVTQF